MNNWEYFKHPIPFLVFIANYTIKLLYLYEVLSRNFDTSYHPNEFFPLFSTMWAMPIRYL